MLLLDSNVFIYARGDHEYSEQCRELIAAAGTHPEWVVPLIVLLELTHYLADGGEYGCRIGDVFSVEPTTLDDFRAASVHATDHADFNDYVILHVAGRLGASGVVSFDHFFDSQELFATIRRREPAALLSE